MKLRSLFPVVATPAVREACEFYCQYFGFAVKFDAGWYVHLHGEREGGGTPLELAFMVPDHESLPPSLRHAFSGQGLFVTLEVDEVDGLYERVCSDGQEILIPLRDEAWGQRHFAMRDPSGGMVDVVQAIPPTAEYLAAYEGEALEQHLGRAGGADED